MTDTLHTTDPAAVALAAATPALVTVAPAGDVVAHHAAGGVSHAGPPIDPARMCAPMRAALGVAATLEGLAADPAAALTALENGEIPLAANNDLGGVGPMAGAITATMPVLVVKDDATGLTAWTPLNEGSGKVLRYGADDEEVVARLVWMRDVLGPSLSRALEEVGPIDLMELQLEALQMGDELHHRTEGATELLLAILAPHVPDDVSAFIGGNGQFALNVAMASAKLALVCASGVPGSSLTTVIARNGVEVGVKLSGTGDQWFVGPAALPEPFALYEGYTGADMNPDLGDSAIVEAYGLGALAIAASPVSAPTVGLDPADATAITAALRPIAGGEQHRLTWPADDGPMPAMLGVDARAVVRERMSPPVHTGIAHRRPGVGQIGGGITHPPMEAYEAAVAALDAT